MKITCKACGNRQEYTGQKQCVHCETRLSDWSIASQLLANRQNERSAER